LVDGKTAEKELTFLLDQKSDRDKATWYLIRGKTGALLEQVNPDDIIKKSSTLPFLSVFAVFNSLYNTKTQMKLNSDRGMKESDLHVLLDQFNEFIASVNIAALSNDDLLAEAKVNQLFMVIDFGTPPPPEITIGNIGDCKNNDELNKFINKRIERIKSITTTYLTTWGELFCKTYAGLNCMPRCVTELTPQLKPENVEKSDFLKVYIPSGRKELLKIPWLSDYVIRSLLIKSKEQSDKVAS